MSNVTISQQLESVLECPLCMSLICEPLTISCGHSFCRVCLVRSLRRHKKKCPTCRAVCHVSAETAEENIMIKSICIAVFPNEYSARLQEIEEEKSSWENLMPIFYYNDCQFPGYILRLHLFEPRYKLMMQRVVNSNRSFAYVPNFQNYNARVGDVALVASLTEAEFLPDGRCIVEAKLTERKLITDHYVEEGTQGLHFCRLGPLKDVPLPPIHSSPTNVQGLAAAVHAIGRQIYEQNRRQIDFSMGEPPRAEDPEALSLWMCMLIPMSTRDKMRMLTSTDTVDRLETVLRMFSTSGMARSARTGAGEEAQTGAAAMVQTLQAAVATIRAALVGSGDAHTADSDTDADADADADVDADDAMGEEGADENDEAEAEDEEDDENEDEEDDYIDADDNGEVESESEGNNEDDGEGDDIDDRDMTNETGNETDPVSPVEGNVSIGEGARQVVDDTSNGDEEDGLVYEDTVGSEEQAH